MFKAIDDTGNGMITEERLNHLLGNSQRSQDIQHFPLLHVLRGILHHFAAPRPNCFVFTWVKQLRTVRAYLETLDLAVPEGTALFHILVPQPNDDQIRGKSIFGVVVMPKGFPNKSIYASVASRGSFAQTALHGVLILK